MKNIEETLAYIHNVKWQKRKPGLERTRELLAALGNPEISLKFVHVAGTNGKGSTCACIASILRAAGYKTGLYISPFVLRFNERMQINGEQISDDELIRLTGEIQPYADVMQDTPTEFEVISALAMRYFLDNNCDVVVLEVGMGGEFDSTNVIESPEVAVITAIGFDHVKELGPELADIARAKAGIIKPGCPVVIYGGEAEADAVFERVSFERGAILRKTDFSRIGRREFSPNGARFEFEPYGEVEIPLAGLYQPKNAAVAVTAVEVLRENGYAIDETDILTGLARVVWPGRFEVLGFNPVFILDGTHNPQGIEATAESFRVIYKDRKAVFLIGVMADKDIDTMIPVIAPLAEAFVAVKADVPRAMETHVLAEKLSAYGIPVCAFNDIGEGVKYAIGRAGSSGIVCSIGTLYFSPAVREAYSRCCNA